MADDIDAILGNDQPKRRAAGGDDIDAILNGGPGQRLDSRGRPYDPRFAPTAEDDEEELAPSSRAAVSRTFTPQSYEAVRESLKPQPKANVSLPPGAPEPGKGEAFARGALQGGSLGFGDEISAAIDTGVSKVPGLRDFGQLFQDASLPPLTNPDVSYEQRRDTYRLKNRAAEEAHGGYYTAGEVAGGLATAPVLPGGGVVGAGVKGAAISAAKAGVTAGLLQGAGSSEADLSAPGGFQQLFKDAARSGIAGGVTGGLLGAVGGKLVKQAPEKEAEALMRGVAAGEGTAGRAEKKAAKLLDRAEENAVPLLRENRDLAKAASKPAKEALPVFEKHLDAVGSKLDPHYDVVDKVTGGVSVTNLVNVLNDEIATLQKSPLNEQYVKAVESIRDSALKAWAPEIGAKVAANARAEAMGLAGGVFKNAEDVMVPTRQVRAMVTRLQKRGTEVINALNPGESSQMKADMARMMKNFIDAHLDVAAEKSPAAANAVEQIRALNKDYSALSTMTQAIEQRGWKEATGATSMLGHVTKALHGIGWLTAAQQAFHGNIPAAVGTLATAYGLPYVPRVLSAGNAALARATRSDTLTANMILRLIEAGVPKATAIQMARSASQGGTINQVAGGVKDALTQ